MGNAEYKVISHIEKIITPSFLDKKKSIKEYNLVDSQVITTLLPKNTTGEWFLPIIK